MLGTAYLIFGSDEYKVSTDAKETIDSILPPQDQAFGIETIDAAVTTVDSAIGAINRCMEGIMTPAMFGAKKVVWLRDASFLGDTPAGKSDDVKARLEALLASIKSGLPAGVSLVITAPKADKRFAFFKAFQNLFNVREFALPDQDYKAERQAGETLDDLLNKAQFRMDGDARDLFLEIVGTDTRHIANEIEKLAVYVGSKKEACVADVEAITSASRESKAWDLQDAFGKKQLGRAIEIMRRLLSQDESPFGLIAMLESRIRDLTIFRHALDAKWLNMTRSERGAAIKWNALPPEAEEAFSSHFEKDPRNLHPFRAGILAAQAGNFTRQKLARCQRAVIEAHQKMVKSAVPDDIILELLLIQMLA